jgi:DNA-binding NarL/FixJ family response regulator
MRRKPMAKKSVYLIFEPNDMREELFSLLSEIGELDVAGYSTSWEDAMVRLEESRSDILLIAGGMSGTAGRDYLAKIVGQKDPPVVVSVSHGQKCDALTEYSLPEDADVLRCLFQSISAA